jgi:hypothetical protein
MSRTPRRSRVLELLARLGYGARGVVYILVGALAVLAAFDLGGRTTGSRGAMRFVLEQPLGWIWLGLIGLGLSFFALWRFVQALTDADRVGASWRGLGARGAQIGSGLAHVALAAFATGLALGWAIGGAAEDGVVKDWTAWLIAQPLGPWVVIGVGGLVVGGGLFFLWKAWSGAGVARHLVCDPGTLRWALPLGRFGVGARGCVYGLVGGFMIVAGWQGRSGAARDMGGALASLEVAPDGWVLLSIVALGLASFGAFGLVQAYFRRIDAPRLEDAGEAIVQAFPGLDDGPDHPERPV